jgi:hypothetical protein
VTRITGTLRGDQHTLMIISHWIIYRMRNVSGKSYRGYPNTYIIANKFLNIMPLWDDVEKYCRAGHATNDSIMQHTCIACWIPKATGTHSDYLIFVVFPEQQWLHKQASKWRYTCMACLVWYCINCITK